MLIITQLHDWSRTGNFFCFLINCISDNLLYYKHEHISLKYLKTKFILFKDMPEILIFSEFSNNNNEIIIEDLFVQPKVPIQNYNEIINKYIKPHIDYNLINNFNINFEKDLIIHIRSGDVFSKNFILDKNMFNVFKSPPYIFYKEIIESNNFNNIYIISENYNLNPIINELCKNYKNVFFYSNDLSTDFKILLNSQYFIPGHSDLSRMVIALSDQKKKCYISKNFFPNINNINYYDYSNYYNIDINTYEEYIDLIMNWQKI